jgi:hypothetical protein
MAVDGFDVPYAMGDVFVAKYDAAGNEQWNLSVSAYPNSANGIAADGVGNVYLTGTFYDSISFGSISLTANGNTHGTADAFIAKIGSTSSAIPPAITLPPQSLTATAGSSVDFAVQANGTFPLFYQWRKDGADVIAATNPWVTLDGVQPTENGGFAVVVTNAFGSVTSSVANLTVNYSLIVNTNGNGAVTRNPNLPSYAPNSTVTLTAVPKLSYGFLGWGGDTNTTANPLVVIMDQNKAFQANFVSTVVTTIVQGRGNVSKSPDKPFYNIGDQITLTALPARYYTLIRWGDGPTVNPRVITIGASNDYTAIFSSTTSVETLSFSNVTRTAPVGIPAIFVDGEFIVTNAVTRFGSAEVSMLTSFQNGSIFFTLDGSTPSFASTLYGGSIVLRRSATIRAIAYDASFLNSWEADPVKVTIEPIFSLSATTPGGGTITVTPTNSYYLNNTLVTLNATPAPGWTFLQWLGDVSGSNATNTLRVTRDMCVQALFGTTLNTTVTGNGSVLADPATSLHPYGGAVQLTGSPQPGNYFAAWGNAASSTNNPLTFTMTNASPTVSCLFAPLTAGEFSLVVGANGGGRVTSSPRGNRFLSGQSVTLLATPDADQDFLSWSGDASGTQTNLVVQMIQSKFITANFTRRPRFSLGPCLGGVREDGFQMTLSGQPTASYQIEASPTLVNWTLLANLTNFFGTVQFTAPLATNQGSRFFRAVVLP